MSSDNKPKIKENYYRYRIQTLIKLGEWVESRESVIRLAANSMHRTWWDYINDDKAYCEYMMNMKEAIEIFNDLQIELNRLKDDLPAFDAIGGKVAMTHRFASKHHRETVKDEA